MRGALVGHRLLERRQLRALLGGVFLGGGLGFGQPGLLAHRLVQRIAQRAGIGAVPGLGLLQLRLELGAGRGELAFEGGAQRRRLAVEQRLQTGPLGVRRGPQRRQFSLGRGSQRRQFGLGRGAQRHLFGLERLNPARQLVGQRRPRFELSLQLGAVLGGLLLIRFEQLQPRREVGDHRVPLVQIEPQGVGGVDGVLALAFEALEPLGQLGDRLLPRLGLAAQQAGHLEQLLALRVERVVPAAQFGELLVVAVEPGKRRRLRVGQAPLLGERLLQAGDLFAKRLGERVALVVGLGEPALELGELLVDGELVALGLARQLDVCQQPLALGVVRRFLFGLPRGGFDQRLLQAPRLGDVTERESAPTRWRRARPGGRWRAARRCGATR